ncbi:MAG: hypothetical protein ACTHJ7_05920, partial [Candidatus Nitrosocosmicus sp.]
MDNQIKLDAEKSNSISLSNDVIKSLVNKFGEKVKIVYDKHNRSKIITVPENLVETAIFLRDNFGF